LNLGDFWLTWPLWTARPEIYPWQLLKADFSVEDFPYGEAPINPKSRSRTPAFEKALQGSAQARRYIPEQRRIELAGPVPVIT
jgi:hypothetical protein